MYKITQLTVASLCCCMPEMEDEASPLFRFLVAFRKICGCPCPDNAGVVVVKAEDVDDRAGLEQLIPTLSICI